MITILKITLLSTSEIVGNYLYLFKGMGKFGKRHSFKKKRWSFPLQKMTPQKRSSPPHGNHAYLSHVACANVPDHVSHAASVPVLRDASSCCVPLDVHQQTTALVTGNHSTAALTGSYLHKLPPKHLRQDIWLWVVFSMLFSQSWPSPWVKP